MLIVSFCMQKTTTTLKLNTFTFTEHAHSAWKREEHVKQTHFKEKSNNEIFFKVNLLTSCLG